MPSEPQDDHVGLGLAVLYDFKEFSLCWGSIDKQLILLSFFVMFCKPGFSFSSVTVINRVLLIFTCNSIMSHFVLKRRIVCYFQMQIISDDIHDR